METFSSRPAASYSSSSSSLLYAPLHGRRLQGNVPILAACLTDQIAYRLWYVLSIVPESGEGGKFPVDTANYSSNRNAMCCEANRCHESIAHIRYSWPLHTTEGCLSWQVHRYLRLCHSSIREPMRRGLRLGSLCRESPRIAGISRVFWLYHRLHCTSHLALGCPQSNH